MLREKSKLFLSLHQMLDVGLTAAAFIAAYFIKRLVLPAGLKGLITAPNYYLVLALIIIIWFVAFEQFGLYKSYRKQSLHQVYNDLFKAVAASFLILVVCLYMLKIKDVSRLMLGIFFVLDILFLMASKGAVYELLRHYRKQGYNIRNILIVGTHDRALETIHSINCFADTGYRIIGCVDVDPALVGAGLGSGVRVIDTIEHLPSLMRQQVVDELVFAMPLKQIPDSPKYIEAAEQLGVTVRVVPDWQLDKIMYKPEIAKVKIEQFLGFITMTLESTPEQQTALTVKGVFDYLFAAVSLVLLSPLFLLVGVAIKLASPGGPVLFCQERCGQNGRRFSLCKFRTMVPDAEAKFEELRAKNEADGPVFKIKNDPRIIPGIGTFLRKTSLDELPQLINILRGEMSLIGPRPPIPHEVELYDPWQRRRISMKPGITCLWQITPNRNEVSFQEWMELDLKYIDNWSLALDAEIFFKTVWVMLTGRGR